MRRVSDLQRCHGRTIRTVGPQALLHQTGLRHAPLLLLSEDLDASRETRERSSPARL
jgi:hypothetical protein